MQGKLTMSCEFWGKARSYFETSISIQPTSEAYLRLAELLETKMDAETEAQKMYSAGLKIAVDQTVNKLPLKKSAADDGKQVSQLKLIQ